MRMRRLIPVLLVLAVAGVCPAAKPVRLLPVLGNHDLIEMEFSYIWKNLVTPQTDIIRLHRAAGREQKRPSLDYYVDWKNVRLIVMDQYGQFGHSRKGDYGPAGLAWVESVIKDAMGNDKIDHVFVSYHEPAFPRNRHTKDSFNANVENRDAFWRMLVKHRAKVRATFVGHTHSYNRLRVADPTKGDEGAPDHAGGVYEVDCGNGGVITTKPRHAVVVRIDGLKVQFVTLEYAPQTGTTKRLDEWKIDGGKAGAKTAPWSFAAISDMRKSAVKPGVAKSIECHRLKTKYARGLLAELRDMKANPTLGKPEFVVLAGDMDDIEGVHADWLAVFGEGVSERK